MAGTVTPSNSIEEQLAEYRRRRSMEREMEEQKIANADINEKDNGRAASNLVNWMEAQWNKVTTKISDALLPDHLRSDARNTGNRLLQTETSAHSATLAPGPSTSPPVSPNAESIPSENPEESSSSISKVFGHRTWMGWTVLTLKFILWLILFKIFIIWEFGAVYFLLSGFVLIWYNLRSGPKNPNEVSAYSVFNKDFKKIHGTYTSEQFEREMLFRR